MGRAGIKHERDEDPSRVLIEESEGKRRLGLPYE
jgi:hypothetical protein